ncbi:MAG: hypothetical protein OSB67_07235 [Alphaproteobacteria bacterium]|nr:hypothetical protein [Alphaproteobacteria bacterium]
MKQNLRHVVCLIQKSRYGCRSLPLGNSPDRKNGHDRIANGLRNATITPAHNLGQNRKMARTLRVSAGGTN